MKQFFFLAALAILVGCSKSNSGDTQKPVVMLSTPIGNQQFPASTMVTISGTVDDNEEIHEVHIIVTNKNNSIEVLHREEHVDAKSYNIHQTFTVQAATTYKIHVEANDHVGNTTEVEIEVKGI